MKNNSLEIKKIKQNLSGIRDIEIRKKAGLMLGRGGCGTWRFLECT